MPEETAPCPGCAAPMQLDQEVCRACRRPRDELEIEKGRDLLRERAEKRRRRPLVAARWALAAAALALGFRHRDFLFGLTSGLRDEVRQEMTNVENPAGPKGVAPPKTAAGAAAIALLGGPAPHVIINSSQAARDPKDSPAPSAGGAQPAAAPQIARRPKEPKEPANGRRLYGLVYDMKSLQPIPFAVIKIRQRPPNGDPYDTQTRADTDGHYEVDFNPYDDDSVSVSAPGYQDGQIEDPEFSYLRRPLEERVKLIADITPADLEAVPLRYRSSDLVISLDLVLVPEDAPAK